MIDGLQHVGSDHKCSVCQCDFTDDEGGIQGYLGIIPVAFCPTCYAGIFDMVEQLEDREWVGLTDGEVDKMILLMGFPPDWITENVIVKNIVRNLEAKLKEKNS